jgi:hypothetical protein
VTFGPGAAPGGGPVPPRIATAPSPPAPPVSLAATVETRRGLLSLFGLIEILVGAACFGLLAVQFVMWIYFSRLAPGERPAPGMSNLLIAALVYALGAAFFVTMGVGTIYARHWARAIMLIVSWPWLLNMVALLAFVVVMLRPLLAMLRSSGALLPQGATLPSGAPLPSDALPPGVTVTPAMLIAIPLGIGVLLTLLPLALIVFYTRPAVVRAFDTTDPRPCWTDGRPLSVLALALVLWVCGAACLSGVVFRAFAMFGVMLTGVPAVLASLALAGAFAWLGLEIYRMSFTGWWANLGFAVLLHLSWWMTLSRLGLEGILGTVQADPDQMRALRQAGLTALFESGWLVLLSAVVWIGVLVGLKRHFRSDSPPSPREVPPSPIRRFPAA